MTLLLLLLAVFAKKNLSNLHKHLERNFEPQDNMKFKSLSVEHKFPFAFEYAKLNDDAVIARDKLTNEIGVFATGHLSNLDKAIHERKTTPLKAADMKLIRDFNFRCVPLDDYEFAGDFNKQTGGNSYERHAFSYIVALSKKTNQTFGDSIDIMMFDFHEPFLRWCEKNPALYREEKTYYENRLGNMDTEKFNEIMERCIINIHVKPRKLYRRNATIERLQGHEILKFSKLAEDPQDLLEKTMYNAFQNNGDNGVVELTNTQAMLLNYGYKYPEKFRPSELSRTASPPFVESEPKRKRTDDKPPNQQYNN